MTTKKTSVMLLAVICLMGIALAIAQPASVSFDGTVSSVNLTAWYPVDGNINDFEGATRAFNVSINQPVNVSWRINGTEVFNKSCVNISEYKASATAGNWNVTAYVHNENSSDSQRWQWSVRTVSANDTTPPAVISHAPTGTKVSVKTDITATFKEPMNPLLLNNATLLVCNSSGSTITGTVTYDSETDTVTFDPLTELEYNETYDVTITEGVQDLAGTNLVSDFCWNFTTRREILITPIIISGYVTYNEGAPQNVSVNITSLNTNKSFAVTTAPNSNYYRMQTDSTHIRAGDTIRFNATDGWSYNETVLTVDDIESGGFRQNLTLVSNMPDLIISDWSSEWISTENGPYNITYTVKNIGDEKADGSSTVVCIDDIEVIEDHVPVLASGANYTCTVGPLPFNCTPRNKGFVIAVCADGDNTVEERNEINNCLTKEFPINLRIPACDMDWFDEANGRFNISYLIANGYCPYPGGAYAAASNTTINITNIMINGSVSNITTIKDPVPTLPPHTRPSAGECYKSTLPFICAPNSTVVIKKVCVDGDDEISESNEADNCWSYEVSFDCPAYKWAPDLKIVNHSVTWVDFVNKTFNVIYTVANIGNENAGASTTHIAGVEYNDPVPVLAPGESVTHTVGPFTLSGLETEITICADSNAVIDESSEENNCCTDSIGQAELVIYIKERRWINALNKTYSVNFWACNRGGAASGACKVYAYIDGSKNATSNITITSVPAQENCIERSIGPFTMTGKNDTIKLCIEGEDGNKRSCTDPTWPISVFRYEGCLADDGTLYACSSDKLVKKSCTFLADMYCDYEHTGKYYGGNGLVIGAAKITIDGNGYAIVGNRSKCKGYEWDDCQYRGISYLGIPYDNVTIKNLEVSNFCNGIAIRDVNNYWIENCSVHDNGPGGDTNKYTYGITVLNSSYTTIDNCSVYNNTGILTDENVCGGHGINFDESSDYCRVTNSHIFHNYLSGILATPTCKYLYIANNIIEENGYCNESGFCAGVNLHWKGGFGITTNSTVENNVIRNNTGPGIYVTQGYTTLTNNLVSRSKNGTNVTGNGIFVDGGRVTYLHNNTCCENDGTDIFDRGFTTYGDDNTCNTTFDYDDEGTFGCNFYCRDVNGACVGATRTFRCGDFVTESCTFNRSMSCRGSAGDGLIVGADDVTIDGAGYALTGNYSGIGIISNHTNVTITNLQVEDFSTGMNIGNANTTVATCVVRTNLVTGLNFSANNGTVRNNLIYDNAGPGIFVDGVNSTFVNNTVARNKGYGIYFSPDASGNSLTANFFGDNEDMEIYNDNGASNTGYNNTCDTAYNYNDTGMTDYNCTYAWTMPDLVISDKHENWVDEKSARYSVTYTVDNIGKPNSRPADSSTTYLDVNYVFTATDGVSSLNASANYSSTFGYTPEMKEDKDTIKVCADGADAVKENNEADTYYYNDVMYEYYNLAGFFADKEANNCLENVFSKCGTIYDWDADAACRAADGTEYRCGDPDPDKRIVMKSCVFTGNMKCPSGHGLIVGRSGIRIDGKDFAIGRDESASSCASVTEINPGGGDCGILNTEHNNVEITNLELVHFCNGIGIQGSKAKPINGNIIERCKIHDNGNPTGKSHGIHMVCVKGTTIRNNEIYNNRGTGVSCGDGGNGIFLYAGGIGTANNVISGNYLHDNDRAGFWTKQGMQGSTINNNNVWGNSRGSGLGGMTGGIVLQCVQSNHNRIEGNEVWDNAGRCGLFIGGDGNTLRNNNVHDNTGDGINMGRNDGSKDNELNGNTVCDNEDMDIRTCGMDYGNTGTDNFCDTTDNYADANAPEGSKCAKKCSTVPKPDLEIKGKNETWIVEGESYNVIYTVQNIGKVAANASTTRIQIINGDSKTHTIRALAAAESETYEVGPFNMSGDSDMIEVCADCEGLVEKYGLDSRANNCKTNTWSALPDLIVTEISLPDRLSFGMPNTITARIKNAGTVRTNKTFTVALFIVPSTVPINTASAPSELLAGSIPTTVTLKWTPPAPGRYTLRVVADSEGEIHESNEGNNEKLLTITEGTLALEMPEGPIRGGGGGGGGATKNTENIHVPGADAGEISTGAATKEVPVNESKTVKEEHKTGTGHPFGEGETLETVKVVAPVFLVVALITIVIVLFYLGYHKEKKVHRRRR